MRECAYLFGKLLEVVCPVMLLASFRWGHISFFFRSNLGRQLLVDLSSVFLTWDTDIKISTSARSACQVEITWCTLVYILGWATCIFGTHDNFHSDIMYVCIMIGGRLPNDKSWMFNGAWIFVDSRSYICGISSSCALREIAGFTITYMPDEILIFRSPPPCRRCFCLVQGCPRW